ncbi:MAG TPA: hypothetical protein VH834_10100 [Solirubrobacteraceae bacterium]|jgi:hypothetical protein
MSWSAKAPGLAEHATIELRRISDVLQVDHASLFLRDPDRPTDGLCVAETGRPLCEALREHAMIVKRALCTGRVQEVEPHDGPDGATGAALATPLERDGETFCVLLVVSVRKNRRLGATDAQVIGRAGEILIERILLAAPREPRHGVTSDRFTRAIPPRSPRMRR